MWGTAGSADRIVREELSKVVPFKPGEVPFQVSKGGVRQNQPHKREAQVLQPEEITGTC